MTNKRGIGGDKVFIHFHNTKNIDRMNPNISFFFICRDRLIRFCQWHLTRTETVSRVPQMERFTSESLSPKKKKEEEENNGKRKYSRLFCFFPTFIVFTTGGVATTLLRKSKLMTAPYSHSTVAVYFRNEKKQVEYK